MLERIKNEPALVGGAVTAVLNALVLLNVVSLSAEQIGGINVALAAVLALLVRANVTPTRTLPDDQRGSAHLLISVVTLLGVVLLLFGIRLR